VRGCRLAVPICDCEHRVSGSRILPTLDHPERVDEAREPVFPVADAHVEAHIEHHALTHRIELAPPRQFASLDRLGRALDIDGRIEGRIRLR
jgi:hypothetical protein